MAEEQRAARDVPRLAPGPLTPRIARLYVENLVRQWDPRAIERDMKEMGARCVLPHRARAAGVRGSLKRLELFYTRVLGCEIFHPRKEDGQEQVRVFYCPLGRLVFSPQGIPCASYCAAMARGVLGEASEGLAVDVERGAEGRCNIQISKTGMGEDGPKEKAKSLSLQSQEDLDYTEDLLKTGHLILSGALALHGARKAFQAVAAARGRTFPPGAPVDLLLRELNPPPEIRQAYRSLGRPPPKSPEMARHYLEFSRKVVVWATRVVGG